MTKTAKTYKANTTIARLNGIEFGDLARQTYWDGAQESKLGAGEYEIQDGISRRFVVISNGNRAEVSYDQMYMIQDQGFRHMIGA